MVIQFQSISTRQNRQKQYNADPRTESLIHLSERTLYVLDNFRFFLFFLKKEMSLNPRLRVLGIKWSTGYGDTETQPFCDVSPDGLNSYTVVSTVSRIHA